MTPTLTAPDPAVFPADVLAFAAERGVSDYLGPLYELTERCFPGADVTTTYEVDWEEPDLAWIVYHVVGGSLDEAAQCAAYRHYIDAKLRLLPVDACGAFATSRQ